MIASQWSKLAVHDTEPESSQLLNVSIDKENSIRVLTRFFFTYIYKLFYLLIFVHIHDHCISIELSFVEMQHFCKINEKKYKRKINIDLAIWASQKSFGGNS